jgi:hypothetical protein
MGRLGGLARESTEVVEPHATEGAKEYMVESWARHAEDLLRELVEHVAIAGAWVQLLP